MIWMFDAFGIVDLIFIWKEKRLPWSDPGEDAWIVPPLRSIICLTMVSPRPIPALFMAAVRCIFPNLLNSKGSSDYVNPAPVSCIYTLRLPLSSSYWVLIVMEPSYVNLIAFLTKLIKTYCSRVASPHRFGNYSIMPSARSSYIENAGCWSSNSWLCPMIAAFRSILCAFSIFHEIFTS